MTVSTKLPGISKDDDDAITGEPSRAGQQSKHSFCRCLVAKLAVVGWSLIWNYGRMYIINNIMG
jgi:hypothetical protein